MDRREALKSIGSALAIIGVATKVEAIEQQPKMIVVTIDDDIQPSASDVDRVKSEIKRQLSRIGWHKTEIMVIHGMTMQFYPPNQTP